MLSKLFDRIIQESKPEILTINGNGYTSKTVFPVKHRPAITNLHTLEGLDYFINSVLLIPGTDSKDYVFNIENTDKVSLQVRCYKWEEYFTVAQATCFKSNNAFRFGDKYDVETFIIRLQSEFAETEDRNNLIKLVSSLTSGSSNICEDDGISQKVTVKRGVTLKGEAVINPRVVLKPYRTFHEVDQPESNYIFRVYSEENSVPKVALFDADGCIWQYKAIYNIKNYLRTKDNNITIIS